MKNALTRNTELTLNIEDSPTEIPVHIRQAKVFKLFGIFQQPNFFVQLRDSVKMQFDCFCGFISFNFKHMYFS